MTKEIIVKYYHGRNNFGDILSPHLAGMISGKKVIGIPEKWKNPDHKTIYIIIGSILQWATVDSVIWGAGFISQNRFWSNAPKKVCAVRGPLSRNKILERGFDCPEVFGDPALLISRYYQPIVKKKWKLGVVPHYIDHNVAKQIPVFKSKEIKIINISSGITSVVDQVLACENIISSSLHGLVVADAYGIPSIWVEFSDRVMGKGFKFADYFASVKRDLYEPLRIIEKITWKGLWSYIKRRREDWKVDTDLDKLYLSCPFRRD